jgi:uncharacterized repeat protein (TIGR01451 family)
MTSKHKKPIFKRLPFGVVSFVVVVVLVAGLLRNFNIFSPISSRATSIVYGNGSIELDKKYFQGGIENDTISTIAGSEVVVRLKYNNTSNTSAFAASINDTLPSGTSFKPGSLRNCYVDSSCIGLADGLFSGSSLQVAPHAGYFGYSTSHTSSNLELGRYKYIKLQTDGNSTQYSERTCNLRADNNALGGSPVTCSSGYFNQELMNVDISGNRYIKLQTDSINSTSNSERTCNLRADNNSGFGTPSFCVDRNTTNEAMVVDILGNRYLKLQTDSINGVPFSERTCNLRSDNNASFGSVGFCGGRNEQQLAMNIDMHDNSRGYGFIEYTMIIPTTISGLQGTNVSMSGDTWSLTDTALNTVDVVDCTTKYPTNWLRNITLSDAELRTDQDFTCNFTPQVCPVVFYDLDNNGVMDIGETNAPNQTLQLLRTDGTTLVDTVITNSAGTNCFNSLAGGGQEYRLRNPNPLTVYPTSGSNTRTIFISSNSNSQTVYFGYSIGSLTMTAPTTTTFDTRNTQSASQTSCAEINPITISDTRISNPGWSLTASIENFQDNTNNLQIPIANKLTMTPGNVSVTSGQTGPQSGSPKTVISTTDQASLASVGAGSGLGNYSLELDLCQQLDPYTPAGNFQTVITYTLI